MLGQAFLEKLLLDFTFTVDMQAEWLQMAEKLEAYNEKQPVNRKCLAPTLSLTSASSG